MKSLFRFASPLLGLMLVLPLFANTAITPAPREEAWVKRHEGFVQIAGAGGVDVLFLGDSFTDGWRNKGKVLWDAHFAPLKATNFGIGGDRTQHVLWRMQNGELDGISPKVVVVMIGTNNIGFERDRVTLRNTVPETIEGVTAIIQGLRTKLPAAKVLLLAVFPRGEGLILPPRFPWNARLPLATRCALAASSPDADRASTPSDPLNADPSDAANPRRKARTRCRQVVAPSLQGAGCASRGSNPQRRSCRGIRRGFCADLLSC